MAVSVAYNDIDDYCCKWLENLVADGQIPAGPVLCRGIETLEPSEVQRYEHVHLFAGIGGWPLAVEQAGWKGPLWTASCPCQPFSNVGRKAGFDDERHLWPTLRRLVAECRPPVVVGEQVENPLARLWLAAVRDELEDLGYAFGAACLPAAGVGAPHSRSRFFWTACDRSRMADADSDVIARTDADPGEAWEDRSRDEPEERAEDPRPHLRERRADAPRAEERRDRRIRLGGSAGRGQPDDDPWHDVEYLPFSDGFSRPVQRRDHGSYRRPEPGLLPLVNGLSVSVARRRTKPYGNAIVPQVAAVFLKALSEAMWAAAAPCPTPNLPERIETAPVASQRVF